MDYRSFISGMVDPDYDAFVSNQSDLRLGLHSAMSLFHLAEWIYKAHESYINANFSWLENNVAKPVKNSKEFPNALADQHPNFELVRSIANASKHLTIGTPVARPIPANRASHAANTYVEYYSIWFGFIKLGGVVTVQGPPGQNIPLFDVLTDVRQWWDTVLNQHGWV